MIPSLKFVLLVLATGGGPYGLHALKCFDETPGQPLKITKCAYFAFGNPQVCFTKRTRDTETDPEGIRGCEYLNRLGVSLGPPTNLGEEPICASRNLANNEAEDFSKIAKNVSVSGLLEVCACTQDLCNMFSYTNETTTTNKMKTTKTTTTMGTTPTIQQQLPLLDDLNSGAILFAPRDIIYLIFLALQTFWVCRISEPICKPCNDVYTK